MGCDCNALARAGAAFVAKYSREPSSPSDAAWLNGYVAACSADETTGNERDSWRCTREDGATTVTADVSRMWELLQRGYQVERLPVNGTDKP